MGLMLTSTCNMADPIAESARAFVDICYVVLCSRPLCLSTFNNGGAQVTEKTTNTSYMSISEGILCY